MRIFHIATLADWQAAQAAGTYAVSTRGRTLAEEGFIHASRGDQWQQVRARYYSDVTEPLVLLSIDTDLLGSPVVDEPVAGTGETFPHVYGPIEVAAVVTVVPLDPPDPARGSPTPQSPDPVRAPSESFSALFLREVFGQLVLASIAFAVVVAGTLVGLATGAEWGPITGAAVGLVLGVLAARSVSRRRTQ